MNPTNPTTPAIAHEVDGFKLLLPVSRVCPSCGEEAGRYHHDAAETVGLSVYTPVTCDGCGDLYSANPYDEGQDDLSADREADVREAEAAHELEELRIWLEGQDRYTPTTPAMALVFLTLEPFTLLGADISGTDGEGHFTLTAAAFHSARLFAEDRSDQLTFDGVWAVGDGGSFDGLGQVDLSSLVELQITRQTGDGVALPVESYSLGLSATDRRSLARRVETISNATGTPAATVEAVLRASDAL